MAAKSRAVNEDMEREVVITRVFDAPREMVFRAWTDPQHVANWWGPWAGSALRGDGDVRGARGEDGADHAGAV